MSSINKLIDCVRTKDFSTASEEFRAIMEAKVVERLQQEREALREATKGDPDDPDDPDDDPAYDEVNGTRSAAERRVTALSKERKEKAEKN
jgi:hypothetical protein